jgi:hypothetical protein
MLRLQYRFLFALGVSLAATASAFADAYAYGNASVTDSLYGTGQVGFGGTGKDVSVLLWDVINTNFAVTRDGPGNSSLIEGGGLLDSGLDAGSGEGWSLFGENLATSDSTDNYGYSDASGSIGSSTHVNSATEDTYNELVFKITNSSRTKAEYYDLNLSGTVLSEVALDDSVSEWGLDESLLEFGYSNSVGDLTRNSTTNESYVLTGQEFGTDTFDVVSNTFADYYQGYLRPGQSVYFGVITENYSAVQANVLPSPAAFAPFAIGLVAAFRRRRRG